MLTYDAVLFDLDGTLTWTLEDIAAAMERALALHGLPGWPTEAYRRLVGNGARVLTLRAVRDRTDLADAVQADYQAWYEGHALVRTRPCEGVPALLAALAEGGKKLAVLSNKPDADTVHVVRHFFPETPFAAIRGQRPGTPLKPDPAGALAVLGELGTAADRVLYLGDSAVDMETARRAGMVPVGVTWGFRGRRELEEGGARFLIDRPAELLEL